VPKVLCCLLLKYNLTNHEVLGIITVLEVHLDLTGVTHAYMQQGKSDLKERIFIGFHHSFPYWKK
jgi:hypothetical protein